MHKILVLFAHPRLESSRINTRLIKEIPQQENITFHDLYETYPEFNVDIEFEKSLLKRHEIVIWHHPFYWYSSPPLLKQWIDMVLEYGWAYGAGGEALKDKIIFNAITTGGNEEAYCEQGYNKYSIRQFMQPFEQTANLCLMQYLPPFAVMGTHNMKGEQIDRAALNYGRLLKVLSNGDLDLEKAKSLRYLNEIL
ncbi:MAG: NAD(P)H oxidoreductase [Pyrinomonadaceae bacterium]|nr:NAD(P)H oxidoreductase [Pyrinomonadaceae bacterium]